MAKKKDSLIEGIIVAGVIVLAPFVWLYNAVGLVWFCIIVIGLFILFIKWWSPAEVAQLKQGDTIDRQQEPQDERDYWLEYLKAIEWAWNKGDFETARQMLQKISYTMVGKDVTKEQKAEFTEVMKQFATVDPFYKEVMARAVPLIAEKPGLVQSTIYKGQPDEVKEKMRYVLYFAHELGHIQRVKKGNSYQLFLPKPIEAVDIL